MSQQPLVRALQRPAEHIAGSEQATSGPRAVELVQNGTLKTYAGFPHGMPTAHADTINNDLLTFIQS
jgi:hypothetical protein